MQLIKLLRWEDDLTRVRDNVNILLETVREIVKVIIKILNVITVIFGCPEKWFAWPVLLLILSTSANADLICKNYQIQYIKFKKKITETENYCVDFKSGKLTSTNCKDLKCLGAIAHSYDELIKGKSKNIGTVGFHLCHKLFGNPQIIKIQKNKKDYMTFDRCRLEGIGTVHTASLENFIKESRR